MRRTNILQHLAAPSMRQQQHCVASFTMLDFIGHAAGRHMAPSDPIEVTCVCVAVASASSSHSKGLYCPLNDTAATMFTQSIAFHIKSNQYYICNQAYLCKCITYPQDLQRNRKCDKITHIDWKKNLVYPTPLSDGQVLFLKTRQT